MVQMEFENGAIGHLFLCREPYVLRAGETLELTYAVYVHDGQASAEDLEQLWGRTFGG